MKISMARLCVAGLAAGLLGTAAQGAVLADFSLSEYTVDAPGGAPDSPIGGPFTGMDVLDAGLASASAEATGVATGGSGSYAGELNYANWHIDGQLDITLTPGAGQAIDLSSLTLNIGRNGGGAPDSMDISIDGGVTTIDTINFTAIHNGVSGAMAATGFEQTFDLTSVADQSGAVTLTITSSSGSSGNVRINDIVVDGAVVPEPGSLALLGLGGLLIARRRRG